MISFVYFDVGGVVIQDFSGTNKWEEMKKDLGFTVDTSRIFDQVWKQYDAEYDFCIDFDVDRLIPIMEKEHKLKLPENYSLLLDMVNRFETNTSIWPVVEKAQRNYPIGLLTNMFPGMLPAIKKRKLLPNIEWDFIVDSSKVGFQKPDKKIFEYASGLVPVPKEEILFIDNTVGHIESAKQFGWQTFLYDSTNPEESSKLLFDMF